MVYSGIGLGTIKMGDQPKQHKPGTQENPLPHNDEVLKLHFSRHEGGASYSPDTDKWYILPGADPVPKVFTPAQEQRIREIIEEALKGHNL